MFRSVCPLYCRNVFESIVNRLRSQPSKYNKSDVLLIWQIQSLWKMTSDFLVSCLVVWRDLTQLVLYFLRFTFFQSRSNTQCWCYNLCSLLIHCEPVLMWMLIWLTKTMTFLRLFVSRVTSRGLNQILI